MTQRYKESAYEKRKKRETNILYFEERQRKQKKGLRCGRLRKGRIKSRGEGVNSEKMEEEKREEREWRSGVGRGGRGGREGERDEKSKAYERHKTI